MREALGITALNSSYVVAYWVPANTEGCTIATLPIISRAIRWRIQCPCSLGMGTRKELEMKGAHPLEDCRMEEERERGQATGIDGLSGGP